MSKRLSCELVDMNSEDVKWSGMWDQVHPVDIYVVSEPTLCHRHIWNHSTHLTVDLQGRGWAVPCPCFSLMFHAKGLTTVISALFPASPACSPSWLGRESRGNNAIFASIPLVLKWECSLQNPRQEFWKSGAECSVTLTWQEPWRASPKAGFWAWSGSAFTV